MQSLINLNIVKDYLTNNHIINEDGNMIHTPINYRWTHGATDLHLGDGLLV